MAIFVCNVFFVCIIYFFLWKGICTQCVPFHPLSKCACQANDEGKGQPGHRMQPNKAHMVPSGGIRGTTANYEVTWPTYAANVWKGNEREWSLTWQIQEANERERELCWLTLSCSQISMQNTGWPMKGPCDGLRTMAISLNLESSFTACK